ncbi:hypothetical protein KC333_g6198 [Hortaea werneckii]|nr:hypothetical protein KC333_g6198 [Hortaea werneckii]
MDIHAMLNVPTVTINGREYYSSAGPACPLPLDKDESERLDFLNIMIYYKQPAQLYRSRLSRVNGYARVLDVGAGTGWWANRVAERDEKAYRVVGIDVVSHWPPFRFPNLEFLQVNFLASDNWLVETDHFQLVHAAMLCGCIPDYPAFYRRLLRHVAPGGFCELIEIDWRPRCDDPNRPPHEAAAFREFWDNLDAASRQAGRPIAYREDTDALLEQAGFVNISHEPVRILLNSDNLAPVSPPSPTAAAAPSNEAIANDFRLAMGYRGSWSAMCMEPFTRYRGWTPADVDYLDERLVEAVNRFLCPFYFHLHFWTAQKPSSTQVC